jgi:signal transduction histidine kinase
MLTPDNNLTVKSNDSIVRARNKQYDRIITELSTKQSAPIPLFSEATSQVTRLTASPISILSLVSDRGCQIGAIDGLELFDKLPTDANLLLELAGIEYCHHQTMICDRSFVVSNFQEHPQLNTTALFQVHGIQAYIGVPIITAAGDRLGVISSLDFIAHQFSDAPEERVRQRDIDLLQLVSRWLASELERKFLSQSRLSDWISDLQDSIQPLYERNKRGFDDFSGERFRQPVPTTEHHGSEENLAVEPITTQIKRSAKQDIHLTHPQIKAEIQFKLLTHLAQELRTPLTSVLGMASVLQQEIYGSLSSKQKDYLSIIYNSGQQLVTIVDEITQLAIFDPENLDRSNPNQPQLTLKSVDLEMLCQLAIQNLEPLLQQKQQQIVLDLSKGNRLWLLDKDKVRQIIYYLSLSLIQGSGSSHQISIELANSIDWLQLQITTTDPHPTLLAGFNPHKRGSASNSPPSSQNELGQDLRVSLGLSLSHTLATLHGGKIELIPHRRGYRLSLPLLSQ